MIIYIVRDVSVLIVFGGHRVSKCSVIKRNNRPPMFVYVRSIKRWIPNVINSSLTLDPQEFLRKIVTLFENICRSAKMHLKPLTIIKSPKEHTCIYNKHIVYHLRSSISQSLIKINYPVSNTLLISGELTANLFWYTFDCKFLAQMQHGHEMYVGISIQSVNKG